MANPHSTTLSPQRADGATPTLRHAESADPAISATPPPETAASPPATPPGVAETGQEATGFGWNPFETDEEREARWAQENAATLAFAQELAGRIRANAAEHGGKTVSERMHESTKRYHKASVAGLAGR